MGSVHEAQVQVASVVSPKTAREQGHDGCEELLHGSLAFLDDGETLHLLGVTPIGRGGIDVLGDLLLGLAHGCSSLRCWNVKLHVLDAGAGGFEPSQAMLFALDIALDAFDAFVQLPNLGGFVSSQHHGKVFLSCDHV